MAVFKCKMCGGPLEFQGKETVAVCEYCGTKQTLPRLDSDRRRNLYDRANHFRRSNEYDRAAGRTGWRRRACPRKWWRS